MLCQLLEEFLTEEGIIEAVDYERINRVIDKFLRTIDKFENEYSGKPYRIKLNLRIFVHQQQVSLLVVELSCKEEAYLGSLSDSEPNEIELDSVNFDFFLRAHLRNKGAIEKKEYPAYPVRREFPVTVDFRSKEEKEHDFWTGREDRVKTYNLQISLEYV